MTKSQAIEAAKQSINELGFVVIEHVPGVVKRPGHQTNVLWRAFVLEETLVVMREATEQEWLAQIAIAERVTGKKMTSDWKIRNGKKYIYVTD